MQADIAALLQTRDFRRLFSGQLVSGFGDWLATFGFISVVYALSGMASAVALVLVLRLVPPMFAGPVGGLIADRWPRRQTMIAADLLRAAIISLAPFANLWQIYIIAVTHECVSLAFLPARDAAMPDIVPGNALVLANGLMLATGYASLPVAGAAFGALHDVAGRYPGALPLSARVNAVPETLAFFADALTFVVSSWFIFRLKYRVSARHLRAHRRFGVWTDMVRSFQVVWQNPRIRKLAYGITVAMFGGGVLFAVGIGYVRQTLHGSSALFGWLTSLWGVGMTAGLLGMRILVRRRGRMYAFIAMVLATGGMLIGMALVPVTIVALAIAVPFGAAFASALALATTMAQEFAGEEHRGFVMGGLQSLYNVGLGIGALSIGTLASRASHVVLFGLTLDGNQFGMLLSGCVIAAAALLMLAVGRRAAVS